MQATMAWDLQLGCGTSPVAEGSAGGGPVGSACLPFVHGLPDGAVSVGCSATAPLVACNTGGSPKFRTRSPTSGNGCWDLTPAPVLLAGADGNIHETRPTASLARDLAQSDAQEATEVPLVANRHARRRSHPNPDERPLQGGAAVSWQVDMSDTVKRSPGSSARTTLADRPIGGFGGAAGPSSPSSPSSGSTFPKRHTYSGGGPSSPSRHKLGGVAAPSRGTRQRVSAPGPAVVARQSSGGDAPTQPPQQRRSLRTYNPINELLDMGFDPASARVAIAAARGDVDLAARIMLEDMRAHNARTQCEWEFEGDAGWAPFDVEADTAIKQAVERGDDCCEVRIAGHRYLLDFANMTQFNMSSRRTRRIRRRSTADT